MEKSIVTISRYWNSPRINTFITNEQIGLKIELDSFVDSLIQEIGSVWSILTKKDFEDRVRAAYKKTLEKIKEESAKII